MKSASTTRRGASRWPVSRWSKLSTDNISTSDRLLFRFPAREKNERYHYQTYRSTRCRRHAGTFGMGVKDTHQHRGVGSALLSALTDLTDNWLNIHRIELTVYTDNDAALALYRKFGFVVEGESKDYAFRHGRFTDVFHMARIRPANTTNR
ncbi:GNAT family N-acetyltransferase [Dickeya fangzhongdai]|uniref:GNAT family N-acetyltransferase n=1 Tax=Dickeya fangzhongdai TaxID=1778540 RepID=UPI00227AC332|nr:GNAT family N-acetyltransferase [Dickeya fangzhongdai]WOY01648.1 GNAT family N-acetyltransferase [Dickeya fangzhongdai]